MNSHINIQKCVKQSRGCCSVGRVCSSALHDLGMAVYCNPSTPEVETGERSEIQGHLRLHSKFESDWVTRAPFSNKINKTELKGWLSDCEDTLSLQRTRVQLAAPIFGDPQIIACSFKPRGLDTQFRPLKTPACLYTYL